LSSVHKAAAKSVVLAQLSFIIFQVVQLNNGILLFIALAGQTTSHNHIQIALIVKFG
jgi:hypothetical protein